MSQHRLHFHHIGLFYRFHLLHRHRFHRPVQYCLRVGPVQLHRITLVFIIVRSCHASIAATPPTQHLSCYDFYQFLAVSVRLLLLFRLTILGTPPSHIY